MGEGNHRGYADAPAHQKAFAWAVTKLEMIDRARDEDAPSFGENAMHQQRSAAPLILAKNRHLIMPSFGRVAGHGILPHHSRGDEHINVPSCRPFRQRRAVERGEFIFADPVRQLFNAADDCRNHRRCLGRRVGIHIAVQMAGISSGKPATVFAGTDERLESLDPGLAVHRVGIGIWMRGKRRRINRHCLVLVPQFQVGAQIAPVHGVARGAIGTILGKLDVPPPFLDVVQPAPACHVVQLCQKFCGLWHVRGGPAERCLGKQAFQVPRACLHAATAHRPTLGGDPIGGAFLAVGLPCLIAVEHALWPGRDRPRRTFASAFLAILTKILQAEIDRLVMQQRHGGGHNAGFQPRAEERMKDHLTDTADLAKTAEKKQRRLQHIAIEDRMRLGGKTEIAYLPRDDPTQKREAQIGAHRLRHRNPVISGRAFHGLESLVDHHADGLVMRRRHGIAAGVVRIPAPVRATRHANRIHPKEIACCLQLVAVPGGVTHRWGIVFSGTALKQHEGPQRPSLRV